MNRLAGAPRSVPSFVVQGNFKPDVGLKDVSGPRLQKNWVSTMNVNFFEWVRDGVRQSVLLGFSDAMEQIGSPPESEEMNDKMAALLGQQAKSRAKRGNATVGRKRLGKSLKEMDVPE